MHDGREVLHGVVGQASVEQWANGVRAAGGQQQGVTIGHRFGSQIAA